MRKQSPWMALAKTLGYVLLFYLSQNIASWLAQFAIYLSMMSQYSMAEITAMLPDVYNSLLYEILILSSLILFGFIALLQRQKMPEQIGFRKTSLMSLVTALFLAFAAYLVATVLISTANEWFPAVKQSKETYVENMAELENLATNPWLEIIYALIVAPVIEEVLCRGGILNTLKRNFHPAVAIVVSAFIFGLIHGNLYQMVFTIPLGILLGYLAYRFQSIWPSILLHVAFNGTNYLSSMGFMLGLGEESVWTYFFYYATTLLCIFSVPIAGILLFKATSPVPALAKSASPAPAMPSAKPVESAPVAPVITKTPPSEPSVKAKTPSEPHASEQKGEPMAAPEFIIVGLGNPGEKYASNRHNCGFMALDYIALRQNATIQNLRFRALTGETVIEGKKVLLMKPQTFMNSSGEAVREAAAYYKIPAENVLVIFDDISFAPGIFRIRKSGSAGGHNGIKSIIACLSSDSFPRIKMGVGTPPQGYELMNWVLGNLPREDLDHVIASMEDVYSTAKAFVKGDLDGASASFNGKSH